MNESGSFVFLLSQYGIVSGADDAVKKIVESPLYFNLSGDVNRNGNDAYDFVRRGVYWSSTVGPAASNAYDLLFTKTTNEIKAQDPVNYRSNAFSIRCLAY